MRAHFDEFLLVQTTRRKNTIFYFSISVPRDNEDKANLIGSLTGIKGLFCGSIRCVYPNTKRKKRKQKEEARKKLEAEKVSNSDFHLLVNFITRRALVVK